MSLTTRAVRGKNNVSVHTWRNVINSIDFLYIRTRRKRLAELLSLLGILDDQGVKVTRASNLELDGVSVLLDASS